MGVRMGRDQRRVRKCRDIVETCLIQMAEIQHDTQRVARPHKPLSGITQPRPGIGRARKPERDTMTEDRRARPDGPERAQAKRVKDMKRVETGIDRLGPLHMHDTGDDAVAARALDLGLDVRID